MRLLTGVVLFLFVSKSVFARITFHFPNTNEGWTCKQKIVGWMNEVDEKLPGGWIPANFHVFYQNTGSLRGGRYKLIGDAYSDEGGFSTESFEHQIILTRCEKSFFIHEYGHVVINDLMLRESPSYRDYLIWTSGLKNVDKTKAGFVERIRDSGERFEQLELVSDTALSPLTELFADTLAVLIMGDWLAIRKSLIPLFEELRTRYPDFSEEDTNFLLATLDHRDFISGLPIENASYKNELVKEDPYCQFTPMRSWIRDTMEGNGSLVPVDMIQALGFGIINVYEKELIPDPDNLGWSLSEKNRSLQKATAYHLHLDTSI